ncbi:uncharacterized protein LOC110349638 isoform X2 [Heterocephalus glaber]|uniref:Uncharacterized protein LOC110349638 isoform X2 n=1 Tax=Heterocephalus glaber TaxID=10181 RepID=A0AAX6T1M0_HETGA|nr:uncharacterized protein LOC110349638 isoform X2 [Heterocephalus glaber]
MGRPLKGAVAWKDSCAAQAQAVQAGAAGGACASETRSPTAQPWALRGCAAEALPAEAGAPVRASGQRGPGSEAVVVRRPHGSAACPEGERAWRDLGRPTVPVCWTGWCGSKEDGAPAARTPPPVPGAHPGGPSNGNSAAPQHVRPESAAPGEATPWTALPSRPSLRVPAGRRSHPVPAKSPRRLLLLAVVALCPLGVAAAPQQLGKQPRKLILQPFSAALLPGSCTGLWPSISSTSESPGFALGASLLLDLRSQGLLPTPQGGRLAGLMHQ